MVKKLFLKIIQKISTKKVVAKKVPPKKTTAKKVVAKKVPPKKTTAKKVVAKKAAPCKKKTGGGHDGGPKNLRK